MINENHGDIGTDIIRFHRLITRSLEITIQNVNRFLEIDAIKESVREGFLKYIQSFSTVLDAHHKLENDKIFPYFMDKLPDAPYDRLITQHKIVKESISHINVGINNLKANGDELELLNLLKTDLRMIDKIWHPHIRIEEEHIYERVGSLKLSFEETNRLRKEYSEFFQENAQPTYLIMPFVLYNLTPEDRAILTQQLPEMVTKQLIPIDWKDKWASMQPFLLK